MEAKDVIELRDDVEFEESIIRPDKPIAACKIEVRRR